MVSHPVWGNDTRKKKSIHTFDAIRPPTCLEEDEPYAHRFQKTPRLCNCCQHPYNFFRRFHKTFIGSDRILSLPDV